jgi:hypothetical protein
MICAKLKPAVSGLEQEFPGQVKAQNLDATAEDAKKVIQELGFQSHGLVIRSADGKALHKEGDHTVDINKVRAAIRELLRKHG